jgi:oligopeptide/dipeptide ABC transporter ATP-binding protein
MSEKRLRSIRGKEITAIQQDPMSSLNPAFRVEDQIVDIIMLHQGLDKPHARKEALTLLSQLGIANCESVMQKFPHQLSGGMAQRIMIGIAFSCSPSLIIADEPTTALDVITQATVIDLMRKLQTKYKTSILFITHNLGLASKVSDNVAVMYAGKIVENGNMMELFRHPCHPYTRGLLLSVPRLDDNSTRISSFEGAVPSLVSLPKGCRFYPRCPLGLDACHTQDEIPLVDLDAEKEANTMHHRSLCVRARELYEGSV